MVDREVVDTRLRHGARPRPEVGNARPGHRELAHDPFHRHDHLRRRDLDRRRREIAVEEVVEVLVGGDARHDGPTGRIVEQEARVAVRDPGRELLQCRVDEGVGHRPELG